MKTSNSLIAMLAGIAAGTVLGILFAPEKGAKTRKKLTRKKEHYVDEVQSQFENLLKSVSKKYSITLKKARELLSIDKNKNDGVQKATSPLKA